MHNICISFRTFIVSCLELGTRLKQRFSNFFRLYGNRPLFVCPVLLFMPKISFSYVCTHIHRGLAVVPEKKCEFREKVSKRRSYVRTIKKFLTIKVSINMKKS